MKTRIVSFHCDPDGGHYYADCARQLTIDCERLQLPHRILGRSLEGDWISAVRAKPTFLLELYDSLRAPFLWVDVDNRVLSAPIEIDGLECDWASVQKEGDFAIWDAVHYVGHSPRTHALLREWKSLCDAEAVVGSHTLLAGLLRTGFVPDLQFQYLPQTYIHGPVITIGLSQTASKRAYFERRNPATFPRRLFRWWSRSNG